MQFILVYIRDPVNPNLVVPIKNLKINVRNLETPSPPSQLVSRILSEVVAKSVTNVDLKTHQSLEMLQNGKLPVQNFLILPDLFAQIFNALCIILENPGSKLLYMFWESFGSNVLQKKII